MPARTLTRKRLASSTTSSANKRRYTPSQRRTYVPRVLRNYSNNGVGFPKVLKSTLRYVETANLASSLGTIGNRVYCLNGLYDPSITVTGHQPMYFDQLMGIYNHYYVTSSKITVTYVGTPSNVSPMSVCLWQNDDATITPGTFAGVCEQSKAMVNLIGNGGDSIVKRTMYWSAAKTFGPNKGMSLLRGNSSSNPSEISCAVITYVASDGGSSGEITVTVEMEFTAEFIELKDIASS